jgi:2-polyprenyl-3-methyl-5-hydroxy-6-metoxy-1,4-benzoquinol methylase
VEELTHCPACGGGAFLPFIACQDKLVSQQTFQIVRCQACQLLFTNPRPTAETIGTYYKSDAYISHDDTQTGLIDTVYRAVRTYTLNQKEKLIRSLNEGRRGAMLDYGCGTGTFLTQCQSVGWDIVGFEPDPDARRLAEQRTGQAILKDLKAVAAQPPLDVITLWHVLEHVPNLNETLDVLSGTLRKDGSLVIAVPNPASADAAKYGSFWAAYDVPRHLYHFTPNVLKQLVEAHGLRLEKQLPMRFDAYYIAMMSTQHRDGKTGYVDSLWQGMRSNAAASHSGNYSSLTYVFKKT